MEFDESFSLQVHGKVCKYSVVFINISSSSPPPFSLQIATRRRREGFQLYVQSSFPPQLDKWLDSSYLSYPFIYLYISIFVI